MPPLRKRFERLIWEVQYAVGYWNYIDGTPDRDVSAAINRHLRAGSVLDLGCGTGNVVRVLGPYTRYRGVDISSVAIGRARRRYAGGKNEFVVANIMDYEPVERFDVILLSEVIYYVEPGAVRGFLDRFRRSLTEGGVFVMRIWDRVSKKPFLDVVTEHFELIESIPVSDNPDSVVLTFR